MWRASCGISPGILRATWREVKAESEVKGMLEGETHGCCKDLLVSVQFKRRSSEKCQQIRTC